MRTLAAALTLGLWACTLGAPEGPHTLPGGGDGKVDNYVSTNAREFELSGAAHVALPESFEEAQLSGLVERRMTVVDRAVRRHIDAVISTANGGITGDDASYFTYFRRDAADSEPAQILEDGRARFTFSIELVGSYYLMSKVAPEASAHRTFTVEVKDWSESSGELVEVEIKGSPSRDAFPRYDELFADGIYDIAIHFGGDYNSERFDIETARWTVGYLLEGGWQNSEVASFDDLTIDSPPFTRSLELAGAEIEARVSIFHSDMVTAENEARLSDAMKASLAAADVVIYSGHAGAGAGFILDYQPRHEIPARDFATLPLADKYQIYVFDGCNTYRTYVDDLLANPAKSFDNLDVVTTVNTTPFGAGYQVIHEFLYWLTLVDAAGSHFPLSWKDILRGVNTAQFSSVHYGVHGVDQDPQLNPHGGADLMCTTCETDADCGGQGNLCLGYPGGAACGVACTTDTACGYGYRCARLYDDPDLFYIPKQCVQTDYICE